MPYTGPEPARRPLSSDDITDGIVSTADLADSAVTIAKIGDAALTALSSVMSSTATAAAQRAALGLDTGDTPDFTGVTFGGGADALDYYDEGTFTPAFLVGATDKTVGTAYGVYTRIGDTVSFAISIIGNRGSDTGIITITGLPFTAGNNNTYPACSFQASDNADPYNGGFLAAFRVQAATSTINAYSQSKSGSWSLAGLDGSTFMQASSNVPLNLAGVYRV